MYKNLRLIITLSRKFSVNIFLPIALASIVALLELSVAFLIPWLMLVATGQGLSELDFVPSNIADVVDRAGAWPIILILSLRLLISKLIITFNLKKMFSISREISNYLITSALTTRREYLPTAKTAYLTLVTHECRILTYHCLIPILMIFAEGLLVCLVILLFLIKYPISFLSAAGVILAFWLLFGRSLIRKIASNGDLREAAQREKIRFTADVINHKLEINVLNGSSFFIERLSSASLKVDTNEIANLSRINVFRVYLEGGAILLLALVVAFSSAITLEVRDLAIIVGAGLVALRLIPSVSRIISASQEFIFGIASLTALHDQILSHESQRFVERYNAKPRVLNGDADPISINVSNVALRYGEVEVFKNVSFSLKSGDHLGLIGSSGSGKSSLLKIILGALAPSAGEVTFNNSEAPTSITNVNFGYVPQEPIILPGSVRENICFGRPISEESPSIISVLRAVGLDELVMSFPEKDSTLIGDGNLQLSGGQSQRIAIARAIWGRPEVLMLDEITSALDETNERIVMQGIQSFLSNTIIISISHKEGLTRYFNKICDLDVV